MQRDDFREGLLQYFDELEQRVSTQDGEWTVKGFIDVYQRIYIISLDTKVLSKVLELLMFPVIGRFADEQGYEIVLAQAQNQYPDMSLISKTDESICYALDVKTTYRTGQDREGHMRISGMTLGTFGGYFRTRDRPVSSTFPYNRYMRHYVLGVIYDRVNGIDERQVYDIGDLADIPSVARNFQFFLQEKYRIASDGPGSGNTKNIGSTKYQDRLINGNGVFAKLGIEVFDDFWMNYRTKAMAREDGFEEPPYTNLKSYQAYKKQGAVILDIPEDDIETETDDGFHDESEYLDI
ncbi:MAG: restriction endonuclease [Anaerolineae bacterium]|nr:MAG: restriction endonuclease [Anaerolineae bacterium]